MQSEILTKKELASTLKVTEKTIDNLRKKGLPFFKVGNNIRFDKNKVLAWLERGGDTMKRKIIEHLESIITKREEVFERYPDDFRNARTIEELQDFIKFIGSLHDDDERFIKLEKCQSTNDVYSPFDTVNNALFRFGFHETEKGKHNSFLTWMADTDTEEFEQYQKENEK